MSLKKPQTAIKYCILIFMLGKLNSNKILTLTILIQYINSLEMSL